MNWRWSLRLTRRISFTKEDEQVLYASVSAMPQSPATKNPNSAVDLAVRPLAEAGDGPNRLKPTYVVEAGKLLSSHPKELWAYRELFLLLVKRDFVGAYKQTVLGPLWFFVQPFLASIVFMVVFGQIARLPTTDLPPLVFYMSGIIAWNFFSNCLTFVAQLLVLFAVIAYYELSGRKIDIGPKIFALPGIVLAMALLALGLGCLIASATVKYRDLNIVVGYTLQLWMFGSFVIYPRSLVPDNLQWLMNLNPMA